MHSIHWPLTGALCRNDGQHTPHEQELRARPLQGVQQGPVKAAPGTRQGVSGMLHGAYATLPCQVPDCTAPINPHSCSPHLEEQGHGPAAPDDQRSNGSMQRQHRGQGHSDPEKCVPKGVQGGAALRENRVRRE